MEKFNKDELFLLAMEMDLPTLLNFCRSSKRINEQVCNRDIFWKYKLDRDFIEYKNLFNLFNFRDKYMLISGLNNLKKKLNRKETIVELYNLRKLNLSKKNLTKIPKEIVLLVNLKYLNLGNNSLTEIPNEIGLLVNLHSLNLINNKLTEIPKEIGLLVNLQELTLQNNKLTEIPKEIGLLVNLQYLNLINNNLSEIPKEIENIPNLYIYK